jgi:prepilin-type N-terminal cleavage/methylation domain-containing protein
LGDLGGFVRKVNGFTLIELVMVIMIAAILSVFAIAKVGLFNGWQESGAGQAMSSQLMAAQRLAIANKNQVFIVVAAQSIKACYDAGCSVPCLNIDGTPMVVFMPSGAIISTASSFSFDSEGRPSFLGAFSIAYAGTTVNVEPETGLIW